MDVDAVKAVGANDGDVILFRDTAEVDAVGIGVNVRLLAAVVDPTVLGLVNGVVCMLLSVFVVCNGREDVLKGVGVGEVSVIAGVDPAIPPGESPREALARLSTELLTHKRSEHP